MLRSIRVRFLIDHPTGAKVHVTDLGVAHLPGRKTHGFARRDEGPVRILLQEFVKCRRSREGDRVVIAIWSKAPSVKNDQDHGWVRTCHCAERFRIGMIPRAQRHKAKRLLFGSSIKPSLAVV